MKNITYVKSVVLLNLRYPLKLSHLRQLLDLGAWAKFQLLLA